MTILNDQHLNTFHRKLYAGFNQAVTFYKRGDNQQAGTVTVKKIFNVRWSRIFTTKEPLDCTISASQSRTLHLPVSEMLKAGFTYVEAGDKFMDRQGRYWGVESTVTLTEKLKETHVDVPCLRLSQ
jgi:hypothetical protein